SRPFVKTDENTIRLPSGNYYFNETVIIPKGLELSIGAGSTIFLNASFISYSPVMAIGSEKLPISIKRLNPESAWGVFVVINAKGEFNQVHFSGGSGDVIHGIYFTGMLASHNSDVHVSNSLFENAGDDDALNIKGGKFVIKNTIFKNNSFDAIDIDFSEGEVVDSMFLNNVGVDGDAIDLSFSEVAIIGNEIENCGDKGISIGEKSTSVVENNEIKGCQIGIAVKDSSYAKIVNSNLTENEIGISLYRKKQVFGGAKASLSNVVFESNVQDTKLDNLSELYYE
ncbi:right-handed parallel beta-helix repeat-containing protein, partial [Patescibacteria group bacterium]